MTCNHLLFLFVINDGLLDSAILRRSACSSSQLISLTVCTSREPLVCRGHGECGYYLPLPFPSLLVELESAQPSGEAGGITKSTSRPGDEDNKGLQEKEKKRKRRRMR